MHSCVCQKYFVNLFLCYRWTQPTVVFRSSSLRPHLYSPAKGVQEAIHNPKQCGVSPSLPACVCARGGEGPLPHDHALKTAQLFLYGMCGGVPITCTLCINNSIELAHTMPFVLNSVHSHTHTDTHTHTYTQREWQQPEPTHLPSCYSKGWNTLCRFYIIIISILKVTMVFRNMGWSVSHLSLLCWIPSLVPIRNVTQYGSVMM